MLSLMFFEKMNNKYALRKVNSGKKKFKNYFNKHILFIHLFSHPKI